MILLSSAALIIWVVSVSLLCLGTWQASKHFLTRWQSPDVSEMEPVTILKPIKGCDRDLQTNLESFFFLHYPKYEIFFSIADANDPAREVIERLMAKYPRFPARLFIGDIKAGANPKVNNLVKGYNEASYDWILISDANIRAEPYDLQRFASVFKKDVGVAAAVVRGDWAHGPGAWIEAAFLNSFHARWLVLAGWLGKPVVIGKSMMFRKTQAARFGGILALSRYLAEDYMAGEAMRMLGLKIKIVSAPAIQPLSDYRFKNFWQRHLRWGRIRKSQAPMAYFLEPWTGALLSGLFGSFAFHSLFDVSYLTFLAAHLAVWILADSILLWSLGGRTSLCMIAGWLSRECLALPMWIHGISGSTVDWKGRKLRLLKGGVLEGA